MQILKYGWAHHMFFTNSETLITNFCELDTFYDDQNRIDKKDSLQHRERRQRRKLTVRTASFSNMVNFNPRITRLKMKEESCGCLASKESRVFGSFRPFFKIFEIFKKF